jgi:hypothetical protein
MLLSKLYRFFLRYTATMDVRCSLKTRTSIIWKTTWRHCWDYHDIRRMLRTGRYDSLWPVNFWELGHDRKNRNYNEKARSS